MAQISLHDFSAPSDDRSDEKVSPTRVNQYLTDKKLQFFELKKNLFSTKNQGRHHSFK